MATKLSALEKKLKICVGDNFKKGDEIMIADAAQAILKCENFIAKIEEEGELICGANNIKYKNPYYEILKFWEGKKRAALIELGLTPRARKTLVGTAQSQDGDKSESKTGRKKSKSQLEKERQEELESEFL